MLFFKKKNNEKDLKAYCNGDLVSIDQVNDEVFSKKMMAFQNHWILLCPFSYSPPPPTPTSLCIMLS